ncbi:MAG: cyclic di-GMP phosphodiesterase [Thermodesulfobacteriota bacterium]|nr:cyclic di-GMP phosphodiesterase [Thermodesulfobacteriota bacterium]
MRSDLTGKSPIDFEMLKHYVDRIASSKERKGTLNWNEDEACLELVEYVTEKNKLIEDLKIECRNLKTAFTETILKLVMAAEFKDNSSSDHVERVGKFSSFMARKMGFSDRDCSNIFFAAAMHDIGKIGISECVLYKPGKLTAPEYEIMKSHTEIGADILAGAKSEVLQLAGQIALNHHERWDGLGYPRGLSGDDIPLVARIVALADTFDALLSRRRYKDAYPIDVAVEVLKTESGEHLDPNLVSMFLNDLDEIIELLYKDDIPPTKQYDLSQRDRNVN